MNTAWKFFRKICSVAVMLALVAGIAVISTQAAANGIYLAAAHAHYKHPVTGQVEDSGGSSSSVLGQSMTESALYQQALVEVDSAGNTFVTIRLLLMDNIQNPQFQTAEGSGSFTPVSATLMQEDAASHSADYRMKVPDENAIIRCNMYITAMGRDVIFYITLSDLTSGSGDFVTSVEVVSQQPAAPSDSADTPAEPQVTQQPTAAQNNSSTGSNTPAQQLQASQGNASQSNVSQSNGSVSGSAQVTENPSRSQIYTADQPSQSWTEADGQNRGDSGEENSTSAEGEQTEVQTEQQNMEESSAASEETTVQSETETTGKEKKAQGIEEFDKDGKEVSTKQTEKQTEEKKSSSKLPVILGIIVVLAAAGAGVYVFWYRKKKGERV